MPIRSGGTVTIDPKKGTEKVTAAPTKDPDGRPAARDKDGKMIGAPADEVATSPAETTSPAAAPAETKE